MNIGVISQPVVNLRQIPGDSPHQKRAQGWPKDPLLDSQLLAGERVILLQQKGAWCEVAVPSQPRFCRGWQPYRGWIPRSSVESLNRPAENTSLVPQHPEQKVHTRPLVWDWELFTAQWEGTPYLWGGASPYRADWPYQRSGVDCSGLVWLAHRALRRIVPRDAHDQWLVSRPLATAQALEPGDLVFFGDLDPRCRVHHVMIFLRDQLLIEASGSMGRVHYSDLRARCRVEPDTPSGSFTGQFRVWFGRIGGFA